MVAAFTFFNLFVRWYEEVYGWSAGLDAFAPEFKTYWMNCLYIGMVCWVVFFCYIGASLWKTRTRDMDAVTSTEEMDRHFHHLVWLVAYGIAIYWGASFYTEQDGTWHQTVIRDTDFTPSHIIEFYMSYPIYIITGWGSFMYARTRIPVLEGCVLALPGRSGRALHDPPERRPQRVGSHLLVDGRAVRSPVALWLRVLRLDGAWLVRSVVADFRTT